MPELGSFTAALSHHGSQESQEGEGRPDQRTTEGHSQGQDSQGSGRRISRFAFPVSPSAAPRGGTTSTVEAPVSLRSSAPPPLPALYSSLPPEVAPPEPGSDPGPHASRSGSEQRRTGQPRADRSHRPTVHFSDDPPAITPPSQPTSQHGSQHGSQRSEQHGVVPGQGSSGHTSHTPGRGPPDAGSSPGPSLSSVTSQHDQRRGSGSSGARPPPGQVPRLSVASSGPEHHVDPSPRGTLISPSSAAASSIPRRPSHVSSRGSDEAQGGRGSGAAPSSGSSAERQGERRAVGGEPEGDKAKALGNAYSAMRQELLQADPSLATLSEHHSNSRRGSEGLAPSSRVETPDAAGSPNEGTYRGAGHARRDFRALRPRHADTVAARDVLGPGRPLSVCCPAVFGPPLAVTATKASLFFATPARYRSPVGAADFLSVLHGGSVPAAAVDAHIAGGPGEVVAFGLRRDASLPAGEWVQDDGTTAGFPVFAGAELMDAQVPHDAAVVVEVEVCATAAVSEFWADHYTQQSTGKELSPAQAAFLQHPPLASTADQGQGKGKEKKGTSRKEKKRTPNGPRRYVLGHAVVRCGRDREGIFDVALRPGPFASAPLDGPEGSPFAVGRQERHAHDVAGYEAAPYTTVRLVLERSRPPSPPLLRTPPFRAVLAMPHDALQCVLEAHWATPARRTLLAVEALSPRLHPDRGSPPTEANRGDAAPLSPVSSGSSEPVLPAAPAAPRSLLVSHQSKAWRGMEDLTAMGGDATIAGPTDATPPPEPEPPAAQEVSTGNPSSGGAAPEVEAAGDEKEATEVAGVGVGAADPFASVPAIADVSPAFLDRLLHPAPAVPGSSAAAGLLRTLLLQKFAFRACERPTSLQLAVLQTRAQAQAQAQATVGGGHRGSRSQIQTRSGGAAVPEAGWELLGRSVATSLADFNAVPAVLPHDIVPWPAHGFDGGFSRSQSSSFVTESTLASPECVAAYSADVDPEQELRLLLRHVLGRVEAAAAERGPPAHGPSALAVPTPPSSGRQLLPPLGERSHGRHDSALLDPDSLYDQAVAQAHQRSGAALRRNPKAPAPPPTAPPRTPTAHIASSTAQMEEEQKDPRDPAAAMPPAVVAAAVMARQHEATAPGLFWSHGGGIVRPRWSAEYAYHLRTATFAPMEPSHGVAVVLHGLDFGVRAARAVERAATAGRPPPTLPKELYKAVVEVGGKMARTQVHDWDADVFRPRFGRSGRGNSFVIPDPAFDRKQAAPPVVIRIYRLRLERAPPPLEKPAADSSSADKQSSGLAARIKAQPRDGAPRQFRGRGIGFRGRGRQTTARPPRTSKVTVVTEEGPGEDPPHRAMRNSAAISSDGRRGSGAAARYAVGGAATAVAAAAGVGSRRKPHRVWASAAGIDLFDEEPDPDDEDTQEGAVDGAEDEEEDDEEDEEKEDNEEKEEGKEGEQDGHPDDGDKAEEPQEERTTAASGGADGAPSTPPPDDGLKGTEEEGTAEGKAQEKAQGKPKGGRWFWTVTEFGWTATECLAPGTTDVARHAPHLALPLFGGRPPAEFAATLRQAPSVSAAVAALQAARSPHAVPLAPPPGASQQHVLLSMAICDPARVPEVLQAEGRVGGQPSAEYAAAAAAQKDRLGRLCTSFDELDAMAARDRRDEEERAAARQGPWPAGCLGSAFATTSPNVRTIEVDSNLFFRAAVFQ